MTAIKPVQFWITRPGHDPHPAYEEVWLNIPEDRGATVLSNACEDWCHDHMKGPVLAEWIGLELRVRFATKRDAAHFKLVWL